MTSREDCSDFHHMSRLNRRGFLRGLLGSAAAAGVVGLPQALGGPSLGFPASANGPLVIGANTGLDSLTENGGLLTWEEQQRFLAHMVKVQWTKLIDLGLVVHQDPVVGRWSSREVGQVQPWPSQPLIDDPAVDR